MYCVMTRSSPSGPPMACCSIRPKTGLGLSTRTVYARSRWWKNIALLSIGCAVGAAPPLQGSRSRRRGPPECPERDRVAQLLGGRDRVLPGPPRRAGQHVAGPGIEPHLPHPPAVARPALEAHAAAAAERHTDHRPERRGVAVPADRGARRIALHEDLDELLGLLPGQ